MNVENIFQNQSDCICVYNTMLAFCSEYQQKRYYCWTMAVICQPKEFN